jgi:putative copper resistance protein D
MLTIAALALGAVVVGSRVAGLFISSLAEPAEPRGRRTLVRIEWTLAVLLVLFVIAAGRNGLGAALSMLGTTGGFRAAGHSAAVGMWLGALLALRLLLGGRASMDCGRGRPVCRAVLRLRSVALVPSAVVAVTGVAASRSLDGWPALVGTRYGKLLLLQAALFTVASGLVIAASVRRFPSPDDADGMQFARRLARLLSMSVAVGSAMVTVAIALTGLASAGEPTVWPFRSRLAPGVMLRFPSVQDQVFTGCGIAVAAVMAAIGAFRIKAWRPLLLALAALLLVTGLYQTLAAMSIDAYPTTYARPAVASTEDSILRGRALFADHCAPCHGPAGRGDGPAGAGLRQRPADLTAPHTSDHTSGDLFWWITHGLGLDMPAFGDRLSLAERWDLVNFVRSLTAGEPLPSTSPTSRP